MTPMMHCAHCGKEHPLGTLVNPDPRRPYVAALPPDHPRVQEQIERIAHGSTPQREYDEQGRFQPWIRREGAA